MFDDIWPVVSGSILLSYFSVLCVHISGLNITLLIPLYSSSIFMDFSRCYSAMIGEGNPQQALHILDYILYTYTFTCEMWCKKHAHKYHISSARPTMWDWNRKNKYKTHLVPFVELRLVVTCWLKLPWCPLELLPQIWMVNHQVWYGLATVVFRCSWLQISHWCHLQIEMFN